MSKRSFKNAVKRNRVVAIPGSCIKNKQGEIVKQFYNIYSLA